MFKSVSDIQIQHNMATYSGSNLILLTEYDPSVCPQGAEGMVGEVALNHHRDALLPKRFIEEVDRVA
jgi:hypothetical protein